MSSAMVKLGDVINVHYGKALKADQRVSNGSVHVFGSSGIVGNHDKTLCSYPTIIIGRKGSVGAITWAPSGGWIIDTAYYVEIKDNNKLDLRYLFYILSGIDLTKKTITTSIPGLNRDDLYDTFIKLPPFEEQKRIVDLLDKAEGIRQKREQSIKLAIGFFVFGPQMLIGMAAAECSHKEAAGAATGFVGLFAYLGASLAGWPLAKVLDTWHWSGFFVVISIAAGISALLLLPFLNAQTPREA